MKTVLIAILLYCVCIHANTQAALKARWCVIGDKEYNKCMAMKTAFAAKSLTPPIECIQVEIGNACLRKIERNEVDLVRVTDSAMYAAGKMHKLVPIMHEDKTGQHAEKFQYKAVAVVKKNNKAINNLNDLRGKKSCHTGTGRTAGWTAPVSFLNARNMLPVTDCENNVKNVASFFSQSCSPGAYGDYYNPDNNNPTNICKLCGLPTCPSNDKYSSYTGAFRCLVDGRGDVAFVKHSTVPYDARTLFKYDTFDYELLCPDGSRNPVKDFSGCTWVTRPTKGVVTRANADINAYKRLLERAATLFHNGANTTFKLFDSKKFGGKNLLFTDGTLDLADTGKKNTYLKYLGDGYTNSFETIRPKSCRKDVRMCVISKDEADKCSDMRDAMATGRITATYSCITGTNREDCMKKIRSNEADIMTADDQQTYIGGAYYQLVPIASEKYPTDTNNEGSSFWAVAVTHKSNAVTIKTLKGKKSCHTGLMDSEGWNIPLGFLAKQKLMPVKSCNVPNSAADFFGGSCVPGATSPAKLCNLCKGKCKRTDMYNGPAGAFRCLVANSADVTFVRHDTIMKNTDGKNNETWAQNLKSADYRLLCKDGTLKAVTEWKTCNLGRVPSRAVLTHQSRSSEYKRHYSIVLGRADARYGSSSGDKSFKMYFSQSGKKDLIFRDDATGLAEVKDKDYRKWLGNDYLGNIQAVDSQKCRTSGAPLHLVSIGTTTFISALLAMLLFV